MFKRKVKTNRKPTSWERLDQLMVLMASDNNYEEYLKIKSQLEIEVKL